MRRQKAVRVSSSKKALPGIAQQAAFGRAVQGANPAAQANAALSQGRVEDALAILERARLSHAFEPEVWRLRAIALFRAKRYQACVEAFDEACERHPGHLPTLISFGNAAMVMGRADRALDIFGHALRVAPGDLEAIYGRGQSELALGKPSEAATRFQSLVTRAPQEPRYWVGLGRALDHCGRLAEAVEAFEGAIAAGEKDKAAAECCIASLLIRLERPAEALARLDKLLAEAPANRQALSLKVIALGRSGATAEARALMGIDDLAADKALPVPPGYADIQSFNAALVKAAKSHTTFANPRPEMPMTHARKTGNLQPNDAPVFDALRAALVGVLQDHIADMRKTGHPYMAGMPAQWRFSIWANVLDRQGEIGAHIHPGAWFSGAYYADMPEGASDPVAKPGWFELGRPRDDLAGPDWQISRFFEARKGHLVLFPSYLYHRTVPFEGTGQRVSFGFDIVPL